MDITDRVIVDDNGDLWTVNLSNEDPVLPPANNLPLSAYDEETTAIIKTEPDDSGTTSNGDPVAFPSHSLTPPACSDEKTSLPNNESNILQTIIKPEPNDSTCSVSDELCRVAVQKENISRTSTVTSPANSSSVASHTISTNKPHLRELLANPETGQMQHKDCPQQTKAGPQCSDILRNLLVLRCQLNAEMPFLLPVMNYKPVHPRMIPNESLKHNTPLSSQTSYSSGHPGPKSSFPLTSSQESNNRNVKGMDSIPLSNVRTTCTTGTTACTSSVPSHITMTTVSGSVLDKKANMEIKAEPADRRLSGNPCALPGTAQNMLQSSSGNPCALPGTAKNTLRSFINLCIETQIKAHGDNKSVTETQNTVRSHNTLVKNTKPDQTIPSNSAMAHEPVEIKADPEVRGTGQTVVVGSENLPRMTPSVVDDRPDPQGSVPTVVEEIKDEEEDSQEPAGNTLLNLDAFSYEPFTYYPVKIFLPSNKIRCLECGIFLNEHKRCMQCSMCSFSTVCDASLSTHYKKKHQVVLNDLKAKELCFDENLMPLGKYKCQQCGLVLEDSPFNRHKHDDFHGKGQFVCIFCMEECCSCYHFIEHLKECIYSEEMSPGTSTWSNYLSNSDKSLFLSMRNMVEIFYNTFRFFIEKGRIPPRQHCLVLRRTHKHLQGLQWRYIQRAVYTLIVKRSISSAQVQNDGEAFHTTATVTTSDPTFTMPGLNIETTLTSGTNYRKTPTPRANSRTTLTSHFINNVTTLTPGTNSRTTLTPAANSRTTLIAPFIYNGTTYTPSANSTTTLTLPFIHNVTARTPSANSRLTLTPGANSRTTLTPSTNSRTTLTPSTISRTTLTSPFIHNVTTLSPGGNSRTTLTPSVNSRTTLTTSANSRTTLTPSANSRTTLTSPFIHNVTTLSPSANSRTTLTPSTNSGTTLTPGGNSRTTLKSCTNSRTTLTRSTNSRTTLTTVANIGTIPATNIANVGTTFTTPAANVGTTFTTPAANVGTTFTTPAANSGTIPTTSITSGTTSSLSGRIVPVLTLVNGKFQITLKLRDSASPGLPTGMPNITMEGSRTTDGYNAPTGQTAAATQAISGMSNIKLEPSTIGGCNAAISQTASATQAFSGMSNIKLEPSTIGGCSAAISQTASATQAFSGMSNIKMEESNTEDGYGAPTIQTASTMIRISDVRNIKMEEFNTIDGYGASTMPTTSGIVEPSTRGGYSVPTVPTASLPTAPTMPTSSGMEESSTGGGYDALTFPTANTLPNSSTMPTNSCMPNIKMEDLSTVDKHSASTIQTASTTQAISGMPNIKMEVSNTIDGYSASTFQTAESDSINTLRSFTNLDSRSTFASGNNTVTNFDLTNTFTNINRNTCITKSDLAGTVANTSRSLINLDSTSTDASSNKAMTKSHLAGNVACTSRSSTKLDFASTLASTNNIMTKSDLAKSDFTCIVTSSNKKMKVSALTSTFPSLINNLNVKFSNSDDNKTGNTSLCNTQSEVHVDGSASTPHSQHKPQLTATNLSNENHLHNNGKKINMRSCSRRQSSNNENCLSLGETGQSDKGVEDTVHRTGQSNSGVELSKSGVELSNNEVNTPERKYLCVGCNEMFPISTYMSHLMYAHTAKRICKICRVWSGSFDVHEKHVCKSRKSSHKTKHNDKKESSSFNLKKLKKTKCNEKKESLSLNLEKLKKRRKKKSLSIRKLAIECCWKCTGCMKNFKNLELLNSHVFNSHASMMKCCKFCEEMFLFDLSQHHCQGKAEMKYARRQAILEDWMQGTTTKYNIRMKCVKCACLKHFCKRNIFPNYQCDLDTCSYCNTYASCSGSQCRHCGVIFHKNVQLRQHILNQHDRIAKDKTDEIDSEGFSGKQGKVVESNKENLSRLSKKVKERANMKRKMKSKADDSLYPEANSPQLTTEQIANSSGSQKQRKRGAHSPETIQRKKLKEEASQEANTCKLCSEKFKSQKAYNKHISAAHGIRKAQHEAYTCKICSKKCCNKRSLRNHVGTVHGIINDKSWLLMSKTISICDECGLAVSSGYLHTHKWIHHRKQKDQYQCGVCQETFYYQLKLKDNLSEVHSVPARTSSFVLKNE